MREEGFLVYIGKGVVDAGARRCYWIRMNET
jgi:hypothetical protein